MATILPLPSTFLSPLLFSPLLPPLLSFFPSFQTHYLKARSLSVCLFEWIFLLNIYFFKLVKMDENIILLVFYFFKLKKNIWKVSGKYTKKVLGWQRLLRGWHEMKDAPKWFYFYTFTSWASVKTSLCQVLGRSTVEWCLLF